MEAQPRSRSNRSQELEHEKRMMYAGAAFFFKALGLGERERDYLHVVPKPKTPMRSI